MTDKKSLNGNYNTFSDVSDDYTWNKIFEKYEKKESKKMEEKRNPLQELMDLDLDKRVLNAVKDYIVDTESVRLTPSGLSIDGKVFSKKTSQLLDTRGTELIDGIPAGFCIPTKVEDIEKGDIVYDSEGKAFHVLGNSSNKKSPELICISPRENTRITMLPTVDILGNQTYNKLITPFNYDFGCNPLLNMLTIFGVGYVDGDLDTAIDKLLPQAIRLISNMDLSSVVKDKRVVFLSPLIVILYKISKKNSFKIDFSLNNIKNSISKVDNKTKIVILLALAMLLYIYKDKIAEKLMSDKISLIPIIGKVNKPIARFLVKIPSIKKNVFKQAIDKIFGAETEKSK